MFAYRGNPFLYWWSVTNCFFNDLNDREIRRIVSGAMVVATLAAVSATSLPVGVLGYCHQLDQQFREFVVHERGFAAMVEVENEWFCLC